MPFQNPNISAIVNSWFCVILKMWIIGLISQHVLHYHMMSLLHSMLNNSFSLKLLIDFVAVCVRRYTCCGFIRMCVCLFEFESSTREFGVLRVWLLELVAFIIAWACFLPNLMSDYSMPLRITWFLMLKLVSEPSYASTYLYRIWTEIIPSYMLSIKQT